MTTIIVLGVIGYVIWWIGRELKSAPSVGAHALMADFAKENHYQHAPQLPNQPTPALAKDLKVLEIAEVLMKGRKRIAGDYARLALSKHGMQSGHQKKFLNDWKEFCNVINAAHGCTITSRALQKANLESYR